MSSVKSLLIFSLCQDSDDTVLIILLYKTVDICLSKIFTLVDDRMSCRMGVSRPRAGATLCTVKVDALEFG